MRTRSGPRALGALALVAALTLGAAGCVPLDEVPDASSSSGGGTANQMLSELTGRRGQPDAPGYSPSSASRTAKTGDNLRTPRRRRVRDGKGIKRSGCNVVGGQWESVYDGRSFTDPLQVDIDHMVPLANAWRSGADEWDDTKRGDFANDLDRPQLFAVSASSNRAKGDQDPSQWKPPSQSYWCQYAHDWVAVKHHWQLTVTSAEKAALTDMLEGCTWESKP